MEVEVISIHCRTMEPNILTFVESALFEKSIASRRFQKGEIVLLLVEDSDKESASEILSPLLLERMG